MKDFGWLLSNGIIHTFVWHLFVVFVAKKWVSSCEIIGNAMQTHIQMLNHSHVKYVKKVLYRIFSWPNTWNVSILYHMIVLFNFMRSVWWKVVSIVNCKYRTQVQNLFSVEHLQLDLCLYFGLYFFEFC